MLIFLSKLLPLFFYPIGLFCIILIFALVFRKKAKTQIFLLIFGLVLLLVCSNRFIALSLARLMESQYSQAQMPHPVGAIIVLGGGTESNQSPRTFVEVNGAGDRVIQAAKLYKEGYAPLIIASGGNISWSDYRATTPAQEMKTLLVFMGVPESAIILEDKSQNTFENAMECQKIMRQQKIKDAILVTSAIHMPRAVLAFQNNEFLFIPYPVDFIVTDLDWEKLIHGNLENTIINILPNESSIRLTTNLMYEFFGEVVYKIRLQMEK